MNDHGTRNRCDHTISISKGFLWHILLILNKKLGMISNNGSKGEQVKILKAIETHLTYEHKLQSKSRIKRLRAGTQPPYRLC
jgi:hypothetical protein